MTRINVVPVTELTDQHLYTEWEEIPRIPLALGPVLKKFNTEQILERIPPTYRLGKGHMLFFQDKCHFIILRWRRLREEMRNRDIEYTNILLDPDNNYQYLDSELTKDYEPTEEALAINRERLAMKIATMPDWYTRKGVSLVESGHVKIIT